MIIMFVTTNSLLYSNIMMKMLHSSLHTYNNFIEISTLLSCAFKNDNCIQNFWDKDFVCLIVYQYCLSSCSRILYSYRNVPLSSNTIAVTWFSRIAIFYHKIDMFLYYNDMVKIKTFYSWFKSVKKYSLK